MWFQHTTENIIPSIFWHRADDISLHRAEAAALRRSSDCLEKSNRIRTYVQIYIHVEEGHTGFLHLPSAVLVFDLITMIQPSLSLVDREVEFGALTN